MKPKELEPLFTQRLEEQLKAAAGLGLDTARMEAALRRMDGVRMVKGDIRRGQPSQLFDALVQAGRTDLTPEALAVSAEFGALFTDDEVNFCFELLCGAGFYRI